MMSSKTGLSRWLMASMILSLAACSEIPGGGGIGGTGKAIAPDALVVGVVDGFGSIILNDQRFETDSAAVFVEGSEAQLSDLSIGMNVVARIASPQGEALQLSYQPDVAGPVASVAEDLSSVVVLGQTVYFNSDTTFDELALSAIVPGVVLEVSGNRDANHDIIATYVREASADARAFTVGRIEIAADGETPLIGNTVIDVSELAAELGMSEQAYIALFLEFGTLVRLEGTMIIDTTDDVPASTNNTTEPATVLSLTEVAALPQSQYNSGDSVQLQGVVGEAVRENLYRVVDVIVEINDDTQAVTRFGLPMEFPQSPENRMVLLNGVALNADGTVLVSQIQFLDED